MLLHLTDRSDEPLHRQISRQLRARILAGDLAEDDVLPSIRAFARDHRVSVITVQRAYEDLEKEELVHTRRGKGFFVSRVESERRRELARTRLEESAAPVVGEAIAAGLAADDVRAVVEDILKKRRAE